MHLTLFRSEAASADIYTLSVHTMTVRSLSACIAPRSTCFLFYVMKSILIYIAWGFLPALVGVDLKRRISHNNNKWYPMQGTSAAIEALSCNLLGNYDSETNRRTDHLTNRRQWEFIGEVKASNSGVTKIAAETQVEVGRSKMSLLLGGPAHLTRNVTEFLEQGLGRLFAIIII